MTRRVVAAGLVAVLALSASAPRAEAFDLLWILEQATNHLVNIDGVTKDISDRLLLAFPGRSLDPILHWWAPARALRDELTELRGDWRLSPNMQRIWRGLFEHDQIGPEEIAALWGVSIPGWEPEVEGWYAASSATRLNALRTRFRNDTQWAEAAAALAREAAHGGSMSDESPYSPGYSERLTAQGTALLGQMAVERGDTDAMGLWLREQQFSEERSERRQERAAAYVLLGFQAGYDLRQLAAEAEREQ